MSVVSTGDGPRRQARGRRRIELILDAAAAVLADKGYDAATTNAIAARAGISPGSLYQYFRDKDDIAQALAAKLAGELDGVLGELAGVGDPDGRPLEELVDAVLRPVLAFNLAHPALKTLFARTDMPAGLRRAVAPLQSRVHDRVAALIGRVLPDRDEADVVRTATVTIQMVRAMVPLLTEAADGERADLQAELRTALVGYLRQKGA